MNRLGQGAAPIVVLGLILLGSTYLMSNATQDSAWFGELYSVLLAVNAVALIGLGVLIAWNLYHLLHQAREQRPGAKLTVRMVIVFVVLSVTPVTIVYYFSLQFLHRGIDSWFDVRIEEALNDALDLSRTALGVRMRELLAQTARIASDIEPLADEQAVSALDDARRLSGASEFTLIGGNGRIVGSSNVDPTAVVPSRPSDAIISQARGSGDYIGLDDIGDSGLHVQVVVSVPSHDAAGEPRLLQALFPVTKRMDTLAHSVESASAKYRELSYLRKPLKLSFTLTLSIVLLVSLFTAVYAAFRSARRMVAPLRDLSEGTKAVASGDYETQLPGAAQDEIGFLVASFNEMTRQLKRAHDETRKSQHLVESQRAYLETVLRRLSTGVLTLDGKQRLVTVNRAATEILGVDLDAMIGKDARVSLRRASRNSIPWCSPCSNGSRRPPWTACATVARKSASSLPEDGAYSSAAPRRWLAARETSSCSMTSPSSSRHSATPPGAKSLADSPTRSRTPSLPSSSQRSASGTSTFTRSSRSTRHRWIA